MKITDISAVYPRYAAFAPNNWRDKLWQIVVRIETDTGHIGYGYGGGGLASLPIVNGHYRELLIGATLDDTDDIAKLWDRLYYESIPYGRNGIAIMALSGVDLAMWDVVAKAQSRTVAALISDNPKPYIPVYATGPDSDWYAQLEVAGQKLSHRYTGRDSDYDDALAAAENARNTIGDDKLLMFDVYMSWDEDVTNRMTELLSPFNIYWFEDVLTPDDYDRLARVRPCVQPSNLAGGEHEFSLSGFQRAAELGAYDIWQPDITWCGGITAGIRIAKLAADHNIKVIPHRGGEVWGLHLIAASDHCDNLAELVLGKQTAQPQVDLWIGQPELAEGNLSINDSPGFGVTPNEAML